MELINLNDVQKQWIEEYKDLIYSYTAMLNAINRSVVLLLDNNVNTENHLMLMEDLSEIREDLLLLNKQVNSRIGDLLLESMSKVNTCFSNED